MRGHGASTERASTERERGAALDWQRFETRDWEAVAADLRAAGTTVHHPALAPGHSHLPMHDLGHDTVLDAILATLPG